MHRDKQIQMGTMGNNECREYVDNLFKNQICAIEFTSSNTTAGRSFHLTIWYDSIKNNYLVCDGDSGGPLTGLLGDGRPKLFGIISFGNDCRPDRASVFSFIPSFILWINETMSKSFNDTLD